MTNTNSDKVTSIFREWQSWHLSVKLLIKNVIYQALNDSTVR